MQGHASYLPFADESFDAVVTSLGVAVVADRPRFLAEAARVLRPGGVFAALTPSLRPANVEDLRIVSRLARHLRVSPQVPGITEFKAKTALAEVGLVKTEDSRAKYYYEVADVADARRLVEGLRMPADPDRIGPAIAFMAEWATGKVLRVPLPMRRIIAIK